MFVSLHGLRFPSLLQKVNSLVFESRKIIYIFTLPSQISLNAQSHLYNSILGFCRILHEVIPISYVKLQNLVDFPFNFTFMRQKFSIANVQHIDKKNVHISVMSKLVT